MRTISLEELLEAGCHFGHRANRRNPKADEFIFEERSGIHVINLEKTQEELMSAATYLRNLAANNGYLILVGTKRQAKEVVDEAVGKAKKQGVSGLFSVTNRWIGGILTNYEAVSRNFKRLNYLDNFLKSPDTKEYTKREVLLFEREKEKLETYYEGVRNLDRIPDAMFVIDVNQERTAVAEARRMGVTVIGIVDTNSDPSLVDYAIPANDDAVGSIKLIIDFIVETWIEGQKKGNAQMQESKKEDEKVKEEVVKKEEVKEVKVKEEKKQVEDKKKTPKQTPEKAAVKTKKKASETAAKA